MVTELPRPLLPVERATLLALLNHSDLPPLDRLRLYKQDSGNSGT